MVTRPFPTPSVAGSWPNLQVSGSWTLETFVSWDFDSTKNARCDNFVGIGIFDTSKQVNTLSLASTGGALEFMAGINWQCVSGTQGGDNFAYWEALNLASGASSASYTPTTFAFRPAAYAFVRIDRDGPNKRWRFGFRYDDRGVWAYSAWQADSKILRTQNSTSTLRQFNAATARIALISRSKGTYRSYGRVHYVRYRPFNCVSPGPVRVMSTAFLNTTMTRLTPGSQYTFTVEARTAVGYGATSTPSPVFTVPAAASTGTLQVQNNVIVLPPRNTSLLIEAARGKPATMVSTTVYNANGVTFTPLASMGNDGTICIGYPSTTCQNLVLTNTNGAGPWWRVDLGVPTTVKEVAIWNRDDVQPERLDNFQVFVGPSPLRSAMNTACNPAQVPLTVGQNDTYAGYSFATRFNCSSPNGLTGRYLMIVGAPGLFLTFRELQVFAANTCVMQRDATNANQVPGTNCAAGAPLGSVCVHTCQNGYVPISGSGASTCTGESWTDPQLVCAPACPQLDAPDNVGSCEQTLVQDDFEDADATRNGWKSLSEAIATLGSNAHIVDGTLQLNVLPGCALDGESLVSVSTKVSSWRGPVKITAVLSTPDRAGVVWRALDAGSFYRAIVDVGRQRVYVQRIGGSSQSISTPITDGDAVLAAGVPVKLVVDHAADGTLNVYINDNLIVQTVEASLSSGTAGVYAFRSGMFYSFEVVAPCTGSCQDATDGDSCTFTCAAGLKAVWSPAVPTGYTQGMESATRTCVATSASTSAWVPAAPPVGGAYTLACTLDPPVFMSTTLYVDENSARNTPVGDPLVATIDSGDYQVVYAISGGNPGNVFYIDACSGQVKVRNPVLNYEAQKNYTLQVTASVSGMDGSATTVDIPIMIRDVQEPPVVQDATCSIAENSPAGFLVCTVVYLDPEGDSATLTLEADGANGLFTLDSNTGRLNVTSFVDYESTPGPFVLIVRATQKGAPLLTTTGKITVNVLDRNDAPRVNLPNGRLTIDQAAWSACITAGLPCSTGINVPAFDQDIGVYAAPTTFSLVSPAVQASVPACAVTAPLTLPTSTGTTGGSALFTINANTGLLTIAQAPGSSVGSLSAFAYSNLIVRAVYQVCVNTSDGTNWAALPAPLAVVATSINVPAVMGVAVVGPASGLLPTAGGASVNITGSGFGSSSTTLIRARLVSSTGLIMNFTGCTVVSDSAVLCPSPVGSGAALTLVVEADVAGSGFAPVLMQSTFVLSYAAPAVTSVSGNTNVASVGGTTLTLVGTDFSAQNTSDAVSVVIGTGATAVACPMILPSPGFSGHTFVRCTIPAGAGADVQWTLTVGGQSVSSVAGQGVTYIPPRITAVAAYSTSTILSALSTVGGERVVVTGTNLGPVSAPVVAGYGDLIFSSCAHRASSPHDTLDCYTAPGVGSAKQMFVSISGVTAAIAASANSTSVLSYAKPVIDGVSGSGAFGGATEGGEDFVITGRNFGPRLYSGAVIDFVAYGRVNATRPWFLGVSCSIVGDTGTRITCKSAPGTGASMSLQVSIGLQTSNMFAAGMRYGAPVVYAFSGDGASDALTQGGQAVVITGKNFGPADSWGNSLLNVSYGTKLDNGPVASLTFTPSDCVLLGAGHSSMQCSTAEGAGRGLVWKVTVDGVDSVQPTTAYSRPTILAIDLQTSLGAPLSAAAVSGGTVAILTGTNFGPCTYGARAQPLVQSVRFGPSGTEYLVTSVRCISHTQLAVTLPGGSGTNLRVVVSVADQASVPSPVTFDYDLPQIMVLMPATAGTYSNPSRPTIITAATVNLPLTNPAFRVSVLFGNGATAWGISPLVPSTPAAVAAVTDSVTGYTNITFSLPQNGAGAELGVQLVVTSSTGATVATSPITPASTFRYADPVISDIIVTRARFAGVNTSSNTDAVPCPFPIGDAVWSCTDPTLLQLTILGSNFAQGADRLDRPDGVTRGLSSVLYNTSLDGIMWTTRRVWLYSWTHDRVVAFTYETATTVRLQLTSVGIDGTTVLNQEVIRSYLRASPEIVAIAGGLTDVPTTGGSASDPLILQVLQLQVGSDAVVTVGGRVATILLQDPACSAGTCSSVTALISAQLTQNGGGSTVTLKVVIPPGQGTAQAVQLTRIDGSTVERSNTGFTVSYARPVITSVKVVSSTGALLDTYPSSNSLVAVPTDGTALLRIYGTNLGLGPTVLMGDAVIYTWTNIGVSPVRACGGAGDPNVATHTCWEVSTAAGEGSGRLYQEYPTGFKLVFSAGNQDAAFIPFSYARPMATSVDSLGGGFPTRGNVLLQITGTNFGTTMLGRPASSLSVNFGTFSPALACTNVTRMSHTLMYCTLPEGSGANLAVTVTVADLSAAGSATISYSRPSISSITVSYSIGGGWQGNNQTVNIDSTTAVGFNNPVAHGRAQGGDRVTINGANFGRKIDRVHCAFFSWSYRRADNTRVPTCNDREDYLGEGEIPASNIISWSHEQIVLRSQPGLGYKDIELSIRGVMIGLPQEDPNLWRFAYLAPQITGMYAGEPTLGPSGSVTDAETRYFDTAGNELVSFVGYNFGPTPRNTSNPAQQLSSELVNVTLNEAPSLPTATVVVVFHKACISAALNIFGARPQINVPLGGSNVPVDRCDVRVTVQMNNRITFYTGEGIGRNRTAYVLVIDGPNVLVSNAAQFNFKAPSITSVNPQVLKLKGADSDNNLDIKGDYFGNAEKADDQGWTQDEKKLQIVIGGYTDACIVTEADQFDMMQPSRRREGNPAKTVAMCQLDPTRVPAGIRNVSLTIVGQTGRLEAVDEMQSLVVACEAGYFGRVNETCLPCPAEDPDPAKTGADCLGFDSFGLRTPHKPNVYYPTFEERFRYPVPRKGWYNLNSSDSHTAKVDGNPSMWDACPPGYRGVEQDRTRDVCIVPCDPPESCLGDNICSEGYASKSPLWRCASCDKGYYKRAGECIKCPDSPAALFIGFILLVIAVAGGGFVLNKRQVNIAVLSIGVDFFQVLAIFAQARIQWPPVVKELLHVLSAFNLNIEIVAPECLIPDVSYKQKFWFIMLLPLCIMAIFGLVFVVLLANKALIKGRPKSKWYTHSPAMVSSCLVLLYLLYLYLTRTIFDVFNCAPTYPPTKRPDGTIIQYLQVVFPEECGVAGGTQMTLMGYAVAGLIVYTAGYPLFIGWTLFKNRALVMEDQLLRAKGVGNDRLSNPHAYELRKMFGRSYFQFKPDWCLWILAIILRKFFIAITAVIFGKNSSFQMAACLLIMFLAYAAQVQVRPYMSPGDYDEVLKSHTEASYTSAVHARLRAAIAGIETRGRKRARKNLINFEGKVDRTAVLGVLTSWLFNYNTVEEGMCFAAIIVCLMAIMYQANELNSYYPQSKDSVTTVLLLVVVVAIVYFATVVITEMVVLYNEGNRAKQLAGKAARGEKLGKDADEASSRASARTKAGPGNEDGFQVGAVESQANPMFLTRAGNGTPGAASMVTGPDGQMDAGLVEAVMSQRESPPSELWHVFRQAFADQSSAVSKMQDQITSLRRQIELNASGAGDVGTPSTPSRKGSTPRTEFAPRAAVGSASGVNPMKLNLGGAGAGQTRSLASMKSVRSTPRAEE